jgi:hypothetical protein
LVPKQITPCFIEAVPLPTEAQKIEWSSKSKTVEFSDVYEPEDDVNWVGTAGLGEFAKAAATYTGSSDTSDLSKMMSDRNARMERWAKHGDRKERQKWEPPAPLGEVREILANSSALSGTDWSAAVELRSRSLLRNSTAEREHAAEICSFGRGTAAGAGNARLLLQLVRCWTRLRRFDKAFYVACQLVEVAGQWMEAWQAMAELADYFAFAFRPGRAVKIAESMPPPPEDVQLAAACQRLALAWLATANALPPYAEGLVAGHLRERFESTAAAWTLDTALLFKTLAERRAMALPDLLERNSWRAIGLTAAARQQALSCIGLVNLDELARVDRAGFNSWAAMELEGLVTRVRHRACHHIVTACEHGQAGEEAAARREVQRAFVCASLYIDHIQFKGGAASGFLFTTASQRFGQAGLLGTLGGAPEHRAAAEAMLLEAFAREDAQLCMTQWHKMLPPSVPISREFERSLQRLDSHLSPLPDLLYDAGRLSEAALLYERTIVDRELVLAEMPGLVQALASINAGVPLLEDDLKDGGRHKFDAGLLTQQLERLASVYQQLGQPKKAAHTHTRLLAAQQQFGRLGLYQHAGVSPLANGASWQSLLQVAINQWQSGLLWCEEKDLQTDGRAGGDISGVGEVLAFFDVLHLQQVRPFSIPTPVWWSHTGDILVRVTV